MGGWGSAPASASVPPSAPGGWESMKLAAEQLGEGDPEQRGDGGGGEVGRRVFSHDKQAVAGGEVVLRGAGLADGAAALVVHAGGGHHGEGVACGAEAVAEFYIFPVEKQVFIEPADVCDGGGSEEHAGTADEVPGAGVAFGGVCAPEAELSAGGSVAEVGACCRQAGVGVHGVDELGECVGVCVGVGVDEPEVGGTGVLGVGDAEVGAGGEACVSAWVEDGPAAVVGGVRDAVPGALGVGVGVADEDACGRMRALAVDAGHAAEGGVGVAVVHDHCCHFWHAGLVWRRAHLCSVAGPCLSTAAAVNCGFGWNRCGRQCGW